MDDIEAIKQLKARYFRSMDTKDWETYRQVFTTDAQFDVFGNGEVINGIDAFMEMLDQTLSNVVTVHHGHMPEITINSPTSASAIWAMEDRLKFPDGSPISEMVGYGHYHDTYVKDSSGWKIKSLRLTRLRVDVS